MIVLDSSVLVAFFNQRDVHHQTAKEAMQALDSGRWGKAIVLEYVFVETLNVVKRKVSIPVALDAGRFLQQSRQLELSPTSDLFGKTWEEFRSDLVSPLSFVDLSIVRVARERAGGKVLTFNPAFREIAGIKVEPA